MTASVSRKWAWQYMAGVTLLWFGLYLEFGWKSVIIVSGNVLIIGAVCEFILQKVQKITAPPSPAVTNTDRAARKTPQ